MKYKNETVERMMEESGFCAPVAVPGGYTLIYIDEHADVFCSDCATKEPDVIESVRTYDEGPNISCCGCGTEIESSYGEPEGEE